MKVAIFGAAGRTGVPLVKQALAEGHEVVAFVRSPEKLREQQGTHERLHVIQGDAKDPGAIAKAVAGADAVISVLGYVRGSDKDVQTRATENIVAAMRKHGVKRLVSLAGAGVRDPKDEPRLFDRAIVGLMKVVAKDVLEDAKRHAEVIRKSGLDWVIVRGPMLTDGPKTDNYRVGYVGRDSGSRLSRADLADFLLKQMTDTAHLHTAPMVSAT